MGYDPFIGEIMLFAGTFAPQGYAMCDGSLLSISQNTALFSLLGTTYGGNGVTNFALPDLRGRVPMGAGSGQGLTPRLLGDKVGAEQATLPAPTIPAPATAVTSVTGIEPAPVVTTASVDSATPPPGPPQTVSTTPPATVLNYCIATWGIYPSRW